MDGGDDAGLSDGRVRLQSGAGTLLNPGNNQTLSVTFTPDDKNDYTTATDSVSINVLPAAPILIAPGSPIPPGPTVSNPIQTFRWNQVTDATTYMLYVWDITAGGWIPTNLISGSATGYTLSGLTAGHYGWYMCAFDGSDWSPQSKEYYFTIASDTTPPTPNPIAWSKNPYATSSTSITMTAKIAKDPSSVEYYFHNMTISGHDSGWQTSRTYTDTGLTPGKKYEYEVKTRDMSPNRNKGKYSTPRWATTLSAATHGTMAKSVGTDAIVNKDALQTAVASPTATTSQAANANDAALTQSFLSSSAAVSAPAARIARPANSAVPALMAALSKTANATQQSSMRTLVVRTPVDEAIRELTTKLRS